MLDAGTLRSGWVKVAGLLVLAACCLTTLVAGEESTLEELKARVSSAPIGDRPHLCLKVAERQLASATKLYQTEENEKARAALADVIAFSEQARDASVQARKHQKQTEITVRSMVRKLVDLKHTIPHDEQQGVQDAIDHLERVRDDLLLSMFPKGKGAK
jgi:hypothetical protein